MERDEADERRLLKLKRALLRLENEAHTINRTSTGREYLWKHTADILRSCGSIRTYLRMETGDEE